MKLVSAIKIMKKSPERNIQLDFFNDKGLVVLQIFRQEDVLSWNDKLKLVDPRGLVLMLRFDNNTDNFKRFQESNFFNQFIKFPKEKIDFYYYGISSNNSARIISKKILNILGIIYCTKSFQFTLNAY